MFTLILLYAAAALLVPWAFGRPGREKSRAMGYAAALVPAATAGWAIARAGDVADGHADTARLSWAPELGLVIDFRLDALAVVMLLLVGGVGAVVLCYAARYFPSGPRTERLAIGTLVAFAGAMTGLVLADNLLVLYVFWELTTVSSFVLIGAGRPERAEDRRAALQALLTTTAFGLVMLVGFVVLGESAGTYRISEIVADPPGGAAGRTAMVLILLGAFAKSAQMPLHAWLPAAMVAPTPVSGYLHAAAMVKAGVYLVARLSPAFAESGLWSPLIVSVGLVSLLLGGAVALRQNDLKRLLAYGTVSQLGFLMVLLGAGTRTAALAGVALLLAHGLFKAPLFLTVGVLEHEEGTRHAHELAGVGRRRPVLAVAAGLAVASMVGLPPLFGYVAKEAALKAFAHGGTDALVLAGIVAGSALTVAYGVRFLDGAFGGRTGETGRPRTPWGLVAPVVVLAVAGFAGGMLTGPVDALLASYADALPAPSPGYHLGLWHGLGLPVALTLAALAVGFVLYWLFGRTFPTPPVRWRVPDAQDAYDGVIAAILSTAWSLTRRVQIGSLPVYLVVIGMMVLLLPGVGLAAGLIGGTAPTPTPDRLRAWDEPAQPALVAIIVVCAVAAVRVRRRLSAALLLAGVGYAVGGLFVVHGSPDVALTLLVVETLSLIMLVLALRRLPDRFPPQRRSVPARIVTAGVSICLGVLVALFMAVAGLSRTASPVGPSYADLAAGEQVKNIVNFILVEARALDTLGEIVVLAVAAMGVAGLVLTGPDAPPLAERGVRPGTALGRPEEGAAARPAAGGPAPGPRHGRVRWLAAPGRPPLGGSSVILEAAARLLGPTLLVFSVYLLIAGHGRPGGGFVGGLVAGMAFVLRYLPGGKRELARAIPVRPAVLLGSGLLTALATGAYGWLIGGGFLASDTYKAHIPVLGDVKVPTSLFFDLGVYLLVLGLVLTILTTLGASLERSPGDTRADSAADSAAERAARDVAGEEPR